MNITKSNIRMLSRIGSCGTYGQAVMKLPDLDDNMVVCTADLCFYSGLDRFKKKYPNRLYNVGIAEQNLIGIAAGLAKEGYNPFVSTYASFASTRALDQVRTNMGYMKLPIKLFGLTSGFSVGILGATHMSIEDIAIMRAIPNITIVSPADALEIYKLTLALANYDKPVYIRLTGGMGMPIVYDEDYNFKIGKSNILKEGEDIVIVASGTIVHTCIQVAEELKNIGISAMVVNMHTIKPLDVELLERVMDYKLMITVEEHSKIGGLGSSIAEYIVEKKYKPLLLKIGIDDNFYQAASYNYLIEESGLTKEKIYNKIIKFIGDCKIKLDIN